MDASVRRKKIAELIAASPTPLTGNELAGVMKVTRQVVVQDIALLRAGGSPIIATPSGYMILEQVVKGRALKVFPCRHNSLEKAEEELMIMVENGGKVRDVIIEHPVYGEISGTLNLSTVMAVKNLIQRLRQKDAQMLSFTTDGVHLHTVEAATEEELTKIENELRSAGILI
ncbi:MAG TPA: transcription repressor NadR [Clostridiales bacterium]|nr:transcription repressor NadR [Clostridiales bacterium]